MTDFRERIEFAIDFRLSAADTAAEFRNCYEDLYVLQRHQPGRFRACTVCRRPRWTLSTHGPCTEVEAVGRRYSIATTATPGGDYLD